MRQLRLETDEQIRATSGPNEAKGDQPASSRRSFLTRAAGVSALAVPTLTLTATSLHDRMDFARMTVDPTSYIAADYRHLARPRRFGH